LANQMNVRGTIDLTDTEKSSFAFKETNPAQDNLAILQELARLHREKHNALLESQKKRQREQEFKSKSKILTSQQQEEVFKIFKIKDTRKIIVTISTNDLRINDFRTLLPGQWLNDEIINSYMVLLNEDCIKTNSTQPTCHFFNTFFFNMVSNYGKGYDYSRVRKWTRNMNIFNYDYVGIPIHVHGNHWCLSVINIKDKRVEYYDSLGDQNFSCLEVLKKYLVDEYKTQKSSDIDLSSWVMYAPGNKNVPQQNNATDCGVFTCQFAACFTNAIDIQNFSQQDMPYFRNRMILELANKNFRFD